MEAKLKLAFKNLHEKYLSKEKYMNSPLGAAQKALKKVREMREARMFNITLYKYKGDVKGIRVVPKNPNTPHTTKRGLKKEEKEEKEEGEEEGEMRIIPEEPEELKEKKEEPKEEPKEEEEEPKQELKEAVETLEDKEPNGLLTEDQIKELMMNLMKMKPQDQGGDGGVGGDEKEEEKEEIDEKPLPRSSANIPQRRRLKELSEEINSPTKPQKPKIVKQVRPIPPRKPRVVKQKYLTPCPSQQMEINDFKPKTDYKNNKADRIQAIHRLIYEE